MAIQLSPTLLRLSAGIPVAAAGGGLGALLAPKGHRREGAARGAGIGYMAGTGLGLGATVGDIADDNPSTRMPRMVAGALGGGAMGLGVGKVIAGKPEWKKHEEFKNELLNLLREEIATKKRNSKTRTPVITELEKISESYEPGPYGLMSWAAENPELAVIPATSAASMALTKPTKTPLRDLLRNGLLGATTGAGIIGGGALGRSYADDRTSGMVLGGGIGGLLSFLLARKALKRIFGSTEKVSKALPPLKTLLEAKDFSDKKDYLNKHRRLRALIAQYPDDFFIDSELDGIVGITHRPTGFKIHATRGTLPTSLRGPANVDITYA